MKREYQLQNQYQGKNNCAYAQDTNCWNHPTPPALVGYARSPISFVQEWCQQAENIESIKITSNYRFSPQRVILLNHHNLPKDQSQWAKRSNPNLSQNGEKIAPHVDWGSDYGTWVSSSISLLTFSALASIHLLIGSYAQCAGDSLLLPQTNRDHSTPPAVVISCHAHQDSHLPELQKLNSQNLRWQSRLLWTLS